MEIRNISMPCVDDAVVEPRARALSALAEASAASPRRTPDAGAPRRRGPSRRCRSASRRSGRSGTGVVETAPPRRRPHAIAAPHVGRAALPSCARPVAAAARSASRRSVARARASSKLRAAAEAGLTPSPRHVGRAGASYSYTAYEGS